jgi:hypothetical protein
MYEVMMLERPFGTDTHQIKAGNFKPISGRYGKELIDVVDSMLRKVFFCINY